MTKKPNWKEVKENLERQEPTGQGWQQQLQSDWDQGKCDRFDRDKAFDRFKKRLDKPKS